MSIKKKRNELFVSKCKDVSHQMVVSSCEGCDELHIAVRLRRPGFFGRIRTAWKYVFGKPSKYGEFEEVTLTRYDSERLRDAIDRKLTEIYNVNVSYGKKTKKPRKKPQTGICGASR